MSKECKNEPKGGGGQKGTSSGNSSSAPSARSGFLVVSQESGQNGQQSFWLRQFIEDRAKTSAVSPREVCKGARFCGIVTEAEHGVVDTAAEGGLICSLALERLSKKLESVGLQFKWVPKTLPEGSCQGLRGSFDPPWNRSSWIA